MWKSLKPAFCSRYFQAVKFVVFRIDSKDLSTKISQEKFNNTQVEAHLHTIQENGIMEELQDSSASLTKLFQIVGCANIALNNLKDIPAVTPGRNFICLYTRI